MDAIPILTLIVLIGFGFLCIFGIIVCIIANEAQIDIHENEISKYLQSRSPEELAKIEEQISELPKSTQKFYKKLIKKAGIKL